MLRDCLGHGGKLLTLLIMLRSLVRFQLAPPTESGKRGVAIPLLRLSRQTQTGASGFSVGDQTA
jgi:hypothetical protein